ncbi:hypothetical protein Vadar_022756 [Vaccinium darrowii]|uniref:Uncharacterized protein n=1 Tax=Vaccinium darrowii TaxID=229202 RepID=A0ACB7ZLQ5_9ERIC|nr:hypothetical protein Vadar_022756 [Vaccinium darrowii]
MVGHKPPAKIVIPGNVIGVAAAIVTGNLDNLECDVAYPRALRNAYETRLLVLQLICLAWLCLGSGGDGKQRNCKGFRGFW